MKLTLPSLLVWQPIDFDEELIRQSPTFQRWLQLPEGQKLKYACREFIKGHKDDEERLMRRIMIARRNNIRDHETLKKARKMQTRPASRKASAIVLQDHVVEREMDVQAVQATRSYKRWMNLPDGAEFVYNQRYVKGKEGHDWLLKKNIWRRMRYRRENKRMVERLKTAQPNTDNHHGNHQNVLMGENPLLHGTTGSSVGAGLHHHSSLGFRDDNGGLHHGSHAEASSGHHHHNTAVDHTGALLTDGLPTAAEEAAAAAAAAAAVDHLADQAAIEAAVAAAENFGKTNSEHHHHHDPDDSIVHHHHHHVSVPDHTTEASAMAATTVHHPVAHAHNDPLLVHDPLQAAAAHAALDAAARLAHISGLPTDDDDDNQHDDVHHHHSTDDGGDVDEVTHHLLLDDDDGGDSSIGGVQL